MTIDSTQSLYSGYSNVTTNTAVSEETGSFLDMMEEAQKKEDDKKKTAKEKAAEKTAEEIKAFFEGMAKAGNALNYVVNSNIEKIKELIAQKKEKLLKDGGYYNEPPMASEQKVELLKHVEEAIAAYTKELMKELEDKSKAEKAAKQDKKGVSLADLLG